MTGLLLLIINLICGKLQKFKVEMNLVPSVINNVICDDARVMNHSY